MINRQASELIPGQAVGNFTKANGIAVEFMGSENLPIQEEKNTMENILMTRKTDSDLPDGNQVKNQLDIGKMENNMALEHINQMSIKLIMDSGKMAST